ncbi:DUF4931 domain-containing protein [Robertmurraya andreesenii]|uniref:ATP adenylyltransferase/5',5'''-P-1,P-4-tetraphosphate phosphorylase II n=1 Tax=Anoxybacillus andreesenii TaxID=1325932 RepID=A0ABT9V2T1_9BACL|nr:DUF4931 domain-containing protein [Robertmurraya andreesenii]MDQ0155256.1 ATP adenylyltransferase/5',5'''-P-1,P-4-tetraphosphate phosphorylase II [Robertmurraya andreesenii]
MKDTHLFFNTEIGVKKPESIRNKNTSCPFCARDELTDIIDTEGSIILLKNKYPVLENAYQTVLIETDDCLSELSLYSKEHLVKLFTFALKHWRAMDESGEFRSVLFFKNHGPLSGGTIAHPHMQIVGLRNIDYMESVTAAQFEGLKIHEQNGVLFSLSTMPRVGFYEFNVKMTDDSQIPIFSSYIQMAAHYILNQFVFRANSYNLFFYKMDGAIYGKIVPRFVTTPLYIGYSIPQVPNNLQWVRDDFVSKYFS